MLTTQNKLKVFVTLTFHAIKKLFINQFILFAQK